MNDKSIAYGSTTWGEIRKRYCVPSNAELYRRILALEQAIENL